MKASLLRHSGLDFLIQFFEIVRFLFRSGSPFLHQRQCEMGRAERRLVNSEYISPDTALEWTRARRSFGNNPVSGASSQRYSAMTRVFYTVSPSCLKQGIRKEGDNSGNSVCVDGSSLETTISSNSSPITQRRSQPRMGQKESFLLLIVSVAQVIPHHPRKFEKLIDGAMWHQPLEI